MGPRKHAIFSDFIADFPPEPAFEEPLDHVAVVAGPDKGLDFRVEGQGLAEVEVEADVVGEHHFPKKLSVALYPP